MIAMDLARVAAVVGVPVQDGWAEVTVTSVEFDTRRVTPGALFVALRGERVDGAAFAAAARAAGAVAVLAAEPVEAGLPVLAVGAPAAGEPENGPVLTALAHLARESVRRLVDEHDLEVVGVTGSSGKTSTKDLIAAVLAAATPAGSEAVIAPPESFNNELGHPYTALRATPDTRFLVLELSARGPGHVAWLASIAPPRIGAVLNVGSAHLGEFGSVEAIATAKAELVEALPPESAGGVAVLNADDGRVAAMAALTAARVVLVGGAPTATVRAQDARQDDSARSSFTLVTPNGTAPVSLRVVGEHQVGNALTAAAIGEAVGMDVATIAAALSAAEPASRWRMEVTELPGGITVVNDAYNANPHSVKAALRALATMGAAGRRTWAVLGEMAELGDGAAAAHDEIGRLVVRLGIGQLLVVDPLEAAREAERAGPAVPGMSGSLLAPTARRSAGRALYLGAHLEGSWDGEAELVPGVDQAVDILLGDLAQGDVVLVKASRSVGLEQVALRVIEGLRARAAAPAPDATSTTGTTSATGTDGTGDRA
ncbi:UDP-N-acetylmuramoyl-tripeptide--D-alanyl-D-alanine ligase [Nakamurella flavida]|uniref:UDP-N-acetylmuramoyl-tripeptide--D-alanyl-D-alanine ligase n=1 Tax=Nakamurella flavida TaxID=363630 RepID=A0A938YLT9_9ACTN|nr:UDP-N-acetylmuramoyl-tripeptide--D-alanyl-D-alanine ligase [Nakamurella flavida]MBM9477534.1 UDP-N-acetylmuramoyl-tripeptide--D-alanyl-D-alanine ligase [Nakamurella flavida]MDP9777467.1 UDP-N-acetylmuramoyl-tripeptide--D-alanyl-D-alanine ligase [Nakamurella flavida]